jgi:hypothetical protein
MKKIICTVALIFISSLAVAANTPCSGRKGGVSHCANGKFVCNDGSVSKSKQVCRMGSDRKKKLEILDVPPPDEPKKK